MQMLTLPLHILFFSRETVWSNRNEMKQVFTLTQE